jgi:hypothetical protein
MTDPVKELADVVEASELFVVKRHYQACS